MRTNQQLGYIVGSSISESEGVRGLVVSVQSAVIPPPMVEQRIDTFLTSYRSSLASMPNAELTVVLEALASQAVDVDKRLGSQAGRLWSEIVNRRYDYGRPWRTSKRLGGVTKAGLVAFFDRHLAPGAPEERRLATHVFAREAVPTELKVDPTADLAFYPPPIDRFAERVGAGLAAAGQGV
uniref:Coenzyme PQQ synthesis protein F-like C-terminal lobe domain-containing protein n=1 Tax=Haptolina brevifila TaxID=156173 RepID=A0A7S2JII1_9EUKA